jgi:hypothetical protein
MKQLTFTLLAAVLFADARQSAQPPATKQNDQQQSAAQQAEAPRMLADNGEVSGNTYTNHFFGFTYQFPLNWTASGEQAKQAVLLNGAKAFEGKVDRDRISDNASRTFVLLAALPQDPTSAAKQSIFIDAVDYSDVEDIDSASGEEYLKNVSPLILGQGFEAVKPLYKTTLGGKDFYRADFKIARDGATTYQALLSTILDQHALNFTFVAPTQAELDALVKTTESVRFEHPAVGTQPSVK